MSWVIKRIKDLFKVSVFEIDQTYWERELGGMHAKPHRPESYFDLQARYYNLKI